MTSKVFSTPARVKQYQNWWMPKASMVQKMARVFHAAGIDKICGGEVALKLHMGEPGDTHYLRPVFAAALVDLIRESGGIPTVIETSGMGTVANRTSEAKHLEAARKNGFSEETIGAPIRMIDGEDGLDVIEHSVVAKGILNFDSVVVLSHVTGHIQAGYGGAIKNIALGCVAKQGKFRVHFENPPSIDLKKCTKCDECIKVCPEDAIQGYTVTHDCNGCSLCLDACDEKAIVVSFRKPADLSRVISDNAVDVMEKVDKIGFINLAVDVLPHCDCHPFSDIPIVPDIGVFASIDPVAVDRACIDKINESAGVKGSASDDANALSAGVDKFKAVNPQTHWKIQLDHTEKMGVGSQDYEIISIE